MTSRSDLQSIEVVGVYGWDYPDFADAYIAYAEHEDGTPYTEEELDAIDDDLVNQLAHEQFMGGGCR